MSRRIDPVTTQKITAALSARAAFGERFALHSATLAGLQPRLVEAVFSRAVWETREYRSLLRAVPDRRVSADRTSYVDNTGGKVNAPSASCRDKPGAKSPL